MNSQQLIDIAMELHAANFAVIPVGPMKNPVLKGWQNRKNENRWEPDPRFISKEMVTGIGVVLGHELHGHYLTAIDLDCLNHQVCWELLDEFLEMLSIDLHRVAFRVGKAPKQLIPVLCTQPVRKHVSASFYDSNPMIKSRLEILGVGQQFVAYGRHSDGLDYQWIQGGLVNAQLPVVRPEHLVDLIERFESIAERYMTRVDNGLEYARQLDEDGDDPFIDMPRPKLVDLPVQKVLDTLRDYSATCLEYDEWLAVGMALYHQYDGSEEAYEIWRDWSHLSPKHDETHMPNKWQSFSTHGRTLTFATILQRAKPYQHLGPITIDQALGGTKADSPPNRDIYRLFEPITRDMFSRTKTLHWLLQGIIRQGTTGVIYGAPKTGKSFVMLDMLLHMAHGLTWCGHKSDASDLRIFYVAGEGVEGVKQRIDAWQSQRGIEETPNMSISKQNVVLASDEVYCDFIAALEATPENLRPTLLALDTLARVTGGQIDENSNSEMSRFVTRLDELRERYGMAIWICHHTPKGDTTTMRGASALQGAVDFSMSVSIRDDRITLVSRDNKDSAGFQDKHFQLNPYQLPLERYVDNFGDPVVSAYLTASEVDSSRQSKPKLSKSGKLVYDAYRSKSELTPESQKRPIPDELLQLHGAAFDGGGLCEAEVRDFFNSMHAGSTPKQRSQWWSRGLDDAMQKGMLVKFDSVLAELVHDILTIDAFDDISFTRE